MTNSISPEKTEKAMYYIHEQLQAVKAIIDMMERSYLEKDACGELRLSDVQHTNLLRIVELMTQSVNEADEMFFSWEFEEEDSIQDILNRHNSRLKLYN